VNGLTLEQVIDELTGPINAPVSLTIERKTREKAFRITLVRQVIYVRSVSSRAVNDIGYINIKTFNEQTHTALVEAVLSLKKDIGRRLRGYIVDLRDNSGGLLDQVIAVADDFLDQGAILISGGRTASDQQRANARPGDIAEGLPIVVLINGNTAAGAEILAATLKGNGRATIVGARTVGNGTVQTIVPLASHGALRLTTSRVVAPSLSNGVIPNLAIAAGSGRGDVQLDAALQYVRAGKRQ
jgi:carboxyl-terminal processing protease